MINEQDVYLMLRDKGLDDKRIYDIAFGISRLAMKYKDDVIDKSYKKIQKDNINCYILELHNSGASIKEIASKVGMAETTISYKLVELGVKASLRIKANGIINTLEIVKQYESGEHTAKIGASFGMHESEVRRKIQRYKANKEWFDRFKGMNEVEIDKVLISERRKIK